jgi:hypothetical protein
MSKRMELGMCVALHGWQVYSGIFVDFFPISVADIHAYASAISARETSRPGGEERVKSWDSAERPCPVNVLAWLLACLEGWIEKN